MSEPIVVSWSEIDTIRQCPHKWDLSYRERWQPPTTADPLARGILYHAALEAHYRAIQAHQQSGITDPEVILAGARLGAQQAITDAERGGSEHAELVQWMYDGYVERYGYDPQWRVLATEFEIRAPLPTSNGRKSRFILKAKIDLIVADERNRLWLVDHKSHKTLPSDKELDLDDQFGVYDWALAKMGKRVHGSIYNTGRTQRNIKPMALDERFSRHLLVRTDREKQALAIDAYETIAPMYAAKAKTPRHPNTDTCRWRCSFTESCLLGRKEGPVREREFMQDVGMIQDHTRH